MMTTLKGPPYFMKNEEWYRYDEEKGKLVLTDKAPPEAVKSYKKFYRLLESGLRPMTIKTQK